MTTATLRGHVALVTGGSRGIGAAIVRALAAQGAAVAINYRDRAGEADALAKEIAAAGGKAIAIGADVSKATAVAQLVQRTTAELGPIDILVNNAGKALSAPFEKMGSALWADMLASNLSSVFLVTQAILPGMAKRGRGRAQGPSRLRPLGRSQAHAHGAGRMAQACRARPARHGRRHHRL